MWIYVITNRVNGKRYVGQTRVSIERRWAQHMRAAKASRTAIAAAIRKYGHQAFEVRWAPLGEISQETLDLIERRLIRHLGTLEPAGYNLEAGGHGHARGTIRRKPHTEETKAKMRAAACGRRMSVASRLKMSRQRRGRRLSAEHRARLAAVALGRKRGPYGVTRQRESWTPERRARLRDRFAGIPLTAEHRANLREAWARRRARGEVAA